MDSKEIVVLRELGLTDGEVRVYLALVGLGNTTVGSLIDKSKISSSKIYIILEKLIQKGLATYIIKGKIKYFQANSPIALMDFLKKKEENLKSQEKDLSKIISKISQITKSSRVEEEARIFKGFGGIKTGLFEAIDTIPRNGEYYFFSSGYAAIEPMAILFSQVAIKLKEKKITINGIADFSEKQVYKEAYLKLGYKMRFVEFFWPSDTSIIGEYLCTLVYDEKEPMLYAIKSKKLVESYKKFFYRIWKMGKPPK